MEGLEGSNDAMKCSASVTILDYEFDELEVLC